jgi:hypothetical protein
MACETRVGGTVAELTESRTPVINHKHIPVQYLTKPDIINDLNVRIHTV